MIWIIIITLLFLLLAWLLLSPLELIIDTRIPVATIRWIGVGKARMIYEKEEWWMNVSILFFRRKWALEKIIFAEKKKKKHTRQKQKKRMSSKIFQKIFSVLRTFRVRQWQITIDSGDDIENAWLYPLNFFPYMKQHVYINFVDENFLVLTIRNIPWRMVYAWIK
jgi:hypothetical protein